MVLYIAARLLTRAGDDTATDFYPDLVLARGLACGAVTWLLGSGLPSARGWATGLT